MINIIYNFLTHYFNFLLILNVNEIKFKLKFYFLDFKKINKLEFLKINLIILINREFLKF